MEQSGREEVSKPTKGEVLLARAVPGSKEVVPELT